MNFGANLRLKVGIYSMLAENLTFSVVEPVVKMGSETEDITS